MKKLIIGVFLLLSILIFSACQAETPTPVPPVLSENPQVTPTETAVITMPTEFPIEEETQLPDSTPMPTDQSVIEDVTQLPDGNLFEWQEIASGFSRPLGLADAGNGNLYIVEQTGMIRVLQNGLVLSEPFLNLQDRVGTQANEQGLLGLALDPDYQTTKLFYVNYTNKKGDTVIARFHANEDFLTANPDREQQLMVIQQPYGNHNGGNIVFGPDDFLYVGMGDGGSGGDPQGNAQNMQTLLGKMLRIAVRGQDLYAVPADNPYVDGGGRSEIFAAGLRNPWRFSFDRKTGDLYIADVGQGDWEEISFAAGNPSGLNYGWDFREGTHVFEDVPPAGLVLVDPILEYDHSAGCSVTGGFVYRGLQLPDLYGVYLYGDYCSGIVWGAIELNDGTWISKQLFSTGLNISSFGQDLQGEVYLIGHSGEIYKLIRK